MKATQLVARVAATLGLLTVFMVTDVRSADAVTTTPCVFHDDATTKTKTLTGDCTTDQTIPVPDGWTLDGAGRIITAVDTVTTLGGHFRGAVVRNAPGSTTATTAHVKNLTVNAADLPNVCDGGDDRLRGILFDGAGGSITNNTVVDINQGQSGCQEGNAIEVRVKRQL